MSLSALFSRWSKDKVLVVGDFLLDTYTQGQVKRVSPEAPVMVVHAKEISKLPGGAGNVALNLASLGCSVSVLGRLGPDSAKEDLMHSLEQEGIDTKYLYTQKAYQTPLKNRVMAEGHQIVRIDFEEALPLSKSLEDQIIADLPKILSNVSTVAISDYAKGFLSDTLLKALIEKAKALNIPVLIDPKGKDFTKYKGAFLIKPNFSEAILASGYEDGTDLELVAHQIKEMTHIPNIMVTRSSQGLSLFTESGAKHFPVKVREVVDVTGAGDTVLAVLTFAIANKIDLDDASILCNLAAGEVVEHLGCARISIKRLAELILKRHLENKVFSDKYLRILQFILDHEEFILVNLVDTESLSLSLFKELKQLKKQHKKSKLVVYFEEEAQRESLVELLASLSEVDFIVTGGSNLKKFCQKHAPLKVYTFSEDGIEKDSALSFS